MKQSKVKKIRDDLRDAWEYHYRKQDEEKAKKFAKAHDLVNEALRGMSTNVTKAGRAA